MTDRAVLRPATVATALVAAILCLAWPAGARAQALKLELLAQGPPRPTGIHGARDGSGRLFLLSKLGTIEVLDGADVLPAPFLDISDQVNSNGVERGLHGLAFHPEYSENGFFYLVYTNLQGDSVLSRWRVSADPDVADPDSEELVLVIEQPDQYHNVSQLQFGPDGYLYVGAGDGGFIGDPGNRAQNLGELLGKILRLDVDGALPYAIPPDNPFVGVSGARPEIWALGVRNPWRFSFGRLTGDLLMGDVGQFSWEEVNFQSAASGGGENYGWRKMEGKHCYNPPSDCFDPDFTLPILEYPHSMGQCAVIGGFVYRGARFPRFQGLYVYGDWCTGRIWVARRVAGQWVNQEIMDSAAMITAFGEAEDGELLLADDRDGRIYRLLDPRPFCDLAVSREVYRDGETVTVSAARLVNLGDAPVTGRLRVVVAPPAGPQVVLLDIGSDGSFQIPAGADFDRGPLPLFTVGPGTPRGLYRLACRLDDAVGGDLLSEDRVAFEIE